MVCQILLLPLRIGGRRPLRKTVGWMQIIGSFHGWWDGLATDEFPSRRNGLGMHASLRSPGVRVSTAVLVLLGSVLLGTCTDGSEPAGPVGESHFSLTLAKDLLPGLAPDQVRPIERIRISAVEVPGGSIVGGTTVTVDPNAGQWTLEFSLPIPTGSTATVTLSVELISLSTGGELVEWSGRTGPITLVVGEQTEVTDIALLKGPLANLSVTGLVIEEPIPVLREGEATQLTVSTTTSTPQDPPTVFWGSLNPGIATVSGTGVVEGVVPGQARITAAAGAEADTVTVTVLQRAASVALNPGGAVLDALGEELVFEATVLDPRGDPIPGEGVSWGVGNGAILQDLGEGRVRSVGRGTTTITAGSTLDPGVVGSAEVVVRQVVAAVDVTPEEAVVFIGDSAPFEAVALDANENLIEGMGFSWSTPNTDLAEVTAEGLALGLAPGSATILAEAASGALGIDGNVSPAPTPGTTGSATLVVLPEIDRVVISPNPFTFRSLGETREFTAQALDESGNPLPVTEFTWGSANETVITVDETGLATSHANGSTVIQATAGGVTGVSAVFVAQRVATVTINPSSWTFVCPEGCESKEFTGRAYDALGSRVPGALFTWSTSESCFDVTAPASGVPASSATVNDICGCDTSPAVLSAQVGGVVGTASLRPPTCGSPTPGAPPICAVREKGLPR